VPSQSSSVSARFAEGAPSLETLINGVPGTIGTDTYMQIDGRTVASLFNYGTFTSFVSLAPGAHSLTVLDTVGYRVGPVAIPSLSGGARYTLILVGSYPSYKVLAFPEPPAGGNAQLSLYEASPTVPQSDFGSFRGVGSSPSSGSDFKRLGSAKLGQVVTVSLGAKVSDIGGYVGTPPCATGSTPVNCLKPAQINSFDTKNALPFRNSSRLSLFLFDTKGGSYPPGPLFGSLDQ